MSDDKLAYTRKHLTYTQCIKPVLQDYNMPNKEITNLSLSYLKSKNFVITAELLQKRKECIMADIAILTLYLLLRI
jgi:hypothetical protein